MTICNAVIFFLPSGAKYCLSLFIATLLVGCATRLVLKGGCAEYISMLLLAQYWQPFYINIDGKIKLKKTMLEAVFKLCIIKNLMF